jgi:copper transport protein
MTRSSLCNWALAGALALSTAAFAFPHTDLKRSDPARDSRLTTVPTRIELWFSARPQLPFSRIRLVGPSGDVALGKLRVDSGDALRADIVAPLGLGRYRVLWQTAGADGHTISGEYAFAVVAPGDTGQQQHVTAPTTDPGNALRHATMRPASPVERVIRWWEYFALFAVLGVLAFRHGVLPPLAARGVQTADASRQARGVGEIAAAIYILSAVFRLIREVDAARNDALGGGPSIMDIVTASSWGHGWLFGVLGAACVLPGFMLSKRGVAAGTPIALTGALAMVLSPALSGHAAADARFVLSVALDATHVATIGAWLGGLFVVLIVGIPAMRRLTDGNPDAAVSALVNSFHPTALLCAPLAILSGVGNSVLRLGSLDALTSTGYGRVLIAKVCLALLVAGSGAYTSTRVRRRLGTPAATTSLRRSATMELALASLVLAATTVLVSSAVPMEMAP